MYIFKLASLSVLKQRSLGCLFLSDKIITNTWADVDTVSGFLEEFDETIIVHSLFKGGSTAILFYILRFWFRNRGMRHVKNCRIVTIC